MSYLGNLSHISHVTHIENHFRCGQTTKCGLVFEHPWKLSLRHGLGANDRLFKDAPNESLVLRHTLGYHRKTCTQIKHIIVDFETNQHEQKLYGIQFYEHISSHACT